MFKGFVNKDLQKGKKTHKAIFNNRLIKLCRGPFDKSETSTKLPS